MVIYKKYAFWILFAKSSSHILFISCFVLSDVSVRKLIFSKRNSFCIYFLPLCSFVLEFFADELNVGIL